MQLQLDTTQTNTIIVGVKADNQTKTVEKANHFGSQILLSTIEEILSKQHKTLKDVDGIIVNEGPGSYTGTRVGVAVANTLAYGLKVSVNDREIGVLAKPNYE